MFSRSEVSKVANQRREDLADYCAALTQLDLKIQTCDEVIDFFEARPDDIKPPDDVTYVAMASLEWFRCYIVILGGCRYSIHQCHSLGEVRPYIKSGETAGKLI